MTTNLSQEDIGIFGSDPATDIRQPGTTDYANGVETQHTAPGPWWNWFWNIFTRWFTHHKADNQSIIAEEENLLSEAHLQPDERVNNQIEKSIIGIAGMHAEEYDTQTTGSPAHYANRPYVSGMTIVLPDTELL